MRDPISLNRFASSSAGTPGVSDVFENIERIEPYCEQAFAALQDRLEVEAGRNAAPLPHLPSPPPARIADVADGRPLLQHCDVITLERHDEKTGVEPRQDAVFVPLRNERIMSKTSAELFMHRNSVMYRIEKIKQLIVSDLDDPDNRLALLISLEVAKAKKEASERRP